MYYLKELCCICLTTNNNLKHISDFSNNLTTYYYKLTTIIPEMCFIELYDSPYLCTDCCRIIDSIYNFRKKCLRNKSIFINYVTKLQSVTPIKGHCSIRLSDFTKNFCNKLQIEESNYVSYVKNEEESDEDNIYSFVQGGKTIGKNILNFIPSSVIVNNPSYKATNEKCETKIIRNTFRVNAVQNTFEPRNTENKNISNNFEPGSYIVTAGQINNAINNFVPLLTKNSNFTKDTEDYKDGRNFEIQEYNQRETVVENNIDNHFDDLSDSNNQITGQEYICEICEKKFDMKNNLKQHLQSHSNVKLFECQKCNKTYKCTKKLMAHLKAHTDEHFTCNVCHKTLAFEHYLYEHMVKHNGELPYGCDLCPSKFNTRRELRMHKRNDILHMNIICSVCKKQFNCVDSLKRHYSRHSNSGKTFLSSNNAEELEGTLI